MSSSTTRWIVSALGSLICIAASTLNLYTIKVYISKQKSGEFDFKLLFLRMLIDALGCILNSSHYLDCISRLITGSEALPFFYYISIASSSLTGLRDCLSMLIAIERLVMVRFPMFFFFHNCRYTLLMLCALILLSYGSFDMIWTLAHCKNSFDILPESDFFYNLNDCPKTVLYSTRSILCLITFLLCLAVNYLLYRNKNQTPYAKTNVKNIVYIALADGITALIFDMGPYIFQIFKTDENELVDQTTDIFILFGKLLFASVIFILQRPPRHQQAKVEKIFATRKMSYQPSTRQITVEEGSCALPI